MSPVTRTRYNPLFEAIDQLLAEPLSIRDLVITRALAEIRETVAREKRRRGELGFDDMLSRLDSALRSESGEVLAAAIRTRFPVAMIDELVRCLMPRKRKLPPWAIYNW